MHSKNRSLQLYILLGLIAVILLHFLIQWIMGRSPILAESYYDEAVTGEMALHILKGEHQLFFWGQPYMGSFEAYLSRCFSISLGHLRLSFDMTVVSIWPSCFF